MADEETLKELRTVLAEVEGWSAGKAADEASARTALSRLLKVEARVAASLSDTSISKGAEVLKEVAGGIVKVLEIRSKLAGGKPEASPTSGAPSASARPALPEFSGDQTEIPASEITLLSKIGAGAFGTVYRARCRGKMVAAKVPIQQTLTERQLAMFRHEMTIMRKVYHPHVVLFLGACTTPGSVVIVTELLYGDLEGILYGENRPDVSPSERIHMALDAALGLNWLHGICQIAHRDLKPANLLLDENRRVKVADFGFSEILGKGKAPKNPGKVRGTIMYAAPEILMGMEWDLSIDVYAFGFILYELVTQLPLFPGWEEPQAFMKEICYNHMRPPVPVDTDEALAALMTECWSANPADRPKFDRVVKRLEAAFVDSCITERTAASMWKRHFCNPLQDRVPWKTFAKAVLLETGTSIASFSGVKELLGDPVKMEPLQNLALWFGPLDAKTLVEAETLYQQPWFHGFLERGVAEVRLRNRTNGTFLVRLSSTDPVACPYTVSLVSAGAVSNKRVFRGDKAGTLRMGTDDGEWLEAQGLSEMVDKLYENMIVSTPCPKEELPY